VDQNGQGCPSNEVYVELFPQGPPPVGPQKPEIGFLTGQPGVPVAVVTGHEHLGRFILAYLPEHPPGIPPAAQYGWGQPVGIAAGIPLGGYWQLRLELARQAGLLRLASPVSAWTAQVPVLADWQLLGLRRCFPAGASQWTFFQENSVSRTALLAQGGWLLPQQQALLVAARSEQWQIGLGGGVRLPLSDAAWGVFTKKPKRVQRSANMVIGENAELGEKRQMQLELGGQLFFHATSGGLTCSPLVQIRLIPAGRR
jgi:hypothetical protein